MKQPANRERLSVRSPGRPGFTEKSAEQIRNYPRYRPDFPRNWSITPVQCGVYISSPEGTKRDANVRRIDRESARQAVLFLLAAVPMLAFAQQSPFDTGANSLVTFALSIATPIAILVVIGAAVAAAVGRISWGWVVGCIVGIAAIFGSPQIVAWIRGMFAV